MLQQILRKNFREKEDAEAFAYSMFLLFVVKVLRPKIVFCEYELELVSANTYSISIGDKVSGVVYSGVP